MLRMLIKYLIQKCIPHQKVYVEDYLYKREVYPLYLIVRNNFNWCMRNGLLTRKDILEFKARLNKCVNLKDYKYEKKTWITLGCIFSVVTFIQLLNQKR